MVCPQLLLVSLSNLLGFQFTFHNTMKVLFIKCNSYPFIHFPPALRVYRIQYRLLRMPTKICNDVTLSYKSATSHLFPPNSSIRLLPVLESLCTCPFLSLQWPLPISVLLATLLLNVSKLKLKLCFFCEAPVLTPRKLIIPPSE